jgi:hypothetical protein
MKTSKHLERVQFIARLVEPTVASPSSFTVTVNYNIAIRDTRWLRRAMIGYSLASLVGAALCVPDFIIASAYHAGNPGGSAGRHLEKYRGNPESADIDMRRSPQ